MTISPTWLLWQDTDHSPAENMAIDELLLESMRDPAARTVVRVYQWSEPAYSIGYFQPYRSAPQGSHSIIRRPSGGGVVDHRNDMTFTLVFPADSPLFQCDRFESYQQINTAVMSAFRRLDVACTLYLGDIPEDHDRSSLVCFEQPAKYDVVTPHGKLCGGAQRRKLYGMLHQGSILRDQLEHISCSKISEALIQAIEEAFNITFSPFTPSPDLLTEAALLARTRYANNQWNRKK